MKNYLKIFVAFGVLITACKKDKTPFPFEPAYNDLEHGWYTEDCTDSWPDHWVDSFNMNSYYIDDHVVFKTPQFNPSNPDEIAYYHINYPENIRQLVKYNLKTTEKTVLTSGITILGEPSWSKNGRIAFALLSNHINLVSENGGAIEQITQIGSNLFPQWSPDGEYLYWGFSASAGQNRYYLRKDMSNAEIDTIYKRNFPNHPNFTYNKISRQNKLFAFSLFNNSTYLTVADLVSPIESVNHLYQIEDFSPGSTTSFCWSHDSQHIYLAYYGTGDIYRVHVETGQIEQLRGGCFGRWLHSIDASPDGKYLVVEKVNLRFTILPNGAASSAVRMQSHITLIDLQTGQMKDLDLE